MAHRLLRHKKPLTQAVQHHFHFHEETLLRLTPQTSIINKVILQNRPDLRFTHSQEVSLQRSFERQLKGFDGPLEELKGKELLKLYMRAYHPFMDKKVLQEQFKNADILERVSSTVPSAISSDEDALSALELLSKLSSTEFGVLRGDYFSSLGCRDNYTDILSTHLSEVPRAHTNPLSTRQLPHAELAVQAYLKKMSLLNTKKVKNSFIVNSPATSELFTNIASKLGGQLVVITGHNFTRPSSTIETHLWDFSSSQRHDIQRATQIQRELRSMKFIAVKDMQELAQLIHVVTMDTVCMGEDSIGDPGTFDDRIKKLEMSILGSF